MKTTGAASLVFIDQRLDIELVNYLVYNPYRMIGSDQLIQAWWKQHGLILVVGLKNDLAVVTLFHTT